MTEIEIEAFKKISSLMISEDRSFSLSMTQLIMATFVNSPPEIKSHMISVGEKASLWLKNIGFVP